MAENKTKPIEASVAEYLSAILGEARRKDCEILSKLITQVTKEKPVMWGPSIVGFGSYHYKYDSGREGDSCIVGFSSRKSDITLYVGSGVLGNEELMGKLGKHKAGKGCLYVKKLGDVDLKILEAIISQSYKARRAYH